MEIMDAGTVLGIVFGTLSIIIPAVGSLLWYVIKGVGKLGRIETNLALMTQDQHSTNTKIDSWKRSTTAHQKEAEAHFMACDTGRAVADQRLDEQERRLGEIESLLD